MLAINQDPVTIEYIEKAISDRGWKEGWIRPAPPQRRTGKSVAVVGSGPTGLAAAQQLNRCGHMVTVFERSEYIGGLLRLGIPDFKLDKKIVQRRVEQMEAEGVLFKTGVHVGKGYPASRLTDGYDAVLLSGGATKPRDLPVPGREMKGVHFAMEYLTQQNRLLSGQSVEPDERITAEGKRVVILGGGDTGADCLGTAHRAGRQGGVPIRVAVRASGGASSGESMAGMADDTSLVGGARGGWGPGLRHSDQEAFGKQRLFT